MNDTRYPSVNTFASSFTDWQKLLTLKSILTPKNLLSLVITKLFVTLMNTSIYRQIKKSRKYQTSITKNSGLIIICLHCELIRGTFPFYTSQRHKNNNFFKDRLTYPNSQKSLSFSYALYLFSNSVFSIYFPPALMPALTSKLKLLVCKIFNFFSS